MRISEETRERVIQAARELNYSPNRAARALRMKKSYTIGIISFDTSDPIPTAYTSSFGRLLNKHGYRTVVSDASHSTARAMEQIEYFAATKADGVILLASSFSVDVETLEKVRQESGIAVISAMHNLCEIGIPSFVVNYYTGAKSTANHLLDAGYRNIAVIVGSAIYAPDHRDRLQGVLDACSERELPIGSKYIVHETSGGWSPALGYKSMKQLLAVESLPDAVVAFDDVTAFGAIRAIYDAGMRVPEDIAVAGFDDLSLSEFFNPPLTTVKHPIEELCASAIDFLMVNLENESTEAPQCHVFEPELVIRRSTLRHGYANRE